MITDIFYLTFTPMITVLAKFILKKNKIVGGLLPHAFTRTPP